MFLLDTNVVSEMKRPRPAKLVAAWISAAPRGSLFVSAITLGEIQAGIEITRAQDAQKAGEIDTWLGAVVETYSVLPIDGTVARTWAKLLHGKSRALSEDAMIAATALVHGLTVVTRNTRDFEGFGVPLLDPFQT